MAVFHQMLPATKHLRGFGLALFLLVSSGLPAAAAQFQFNVLVQLGQNNNNFPNGWEVGWGPNSGAPTVLGSLPTYWSSGSSREVAFIYDGTANNLELRVYDHNSSNYAYAFYTPPNGPGLPNEVWRMPASSFFVTALGPRPGAGGSGSITVSNLSLTTPSGGALNVLSPLQSTPITVSTGASTQTLSLSQDAVFQADATGSWRMDGFVTMNFSNLTGGNNYNRLQFGFAAASETPEPSTFAMLAVGLALIGIGTRRLPRN